ncbi:MAG: GNAT family N-acetyltransferase [Acetatifactor sp.]|nr:GNAT family N-acetyltransferase [Acetatifactor sp.]
MNQKAAARIDRLMTEKEKVLYNVFYLILENDKSFWASDEKTYIVGQSNERLPMWIWMDKKAPESAYDEVETIVKEHLALNPGLKVTGDDDQMRKILDRVAKETGVSFERAVPMVIYRCDKVTNPKRASGHSIYSDESHKPILEQFITGMVSDLAHRPMAEKEAEGFADAVAGSKELLLWEDAGKVVSMAMVAHKTNTFARINTVYTDKQQRGKGYAGMLVGELTQKLLDEGFIPMLYTEQDNVCSNATYRRIGFKSCGELVTSKACI